MFSRESMNHGNELGGWQDSYSRDVFAIEIKINPNEILGYASRIWGSYVSWVLLGEMFTGGWV